MLSGTFYIGTPAELEKLRTSGLMNEAFTKQVWTSVESSATQAKCWDPNEGAGWKDIDKSTQASCIFIKSF